MSEELPDIIINGRLHRWIEPDGYVKINDNSDVIDDLRDIDTE